MAESNSTVPPDDKIPPVSPSPPPPPSLEPDTVTDWGYARSRAAIAAGVLVCIMFVPFLAPLSIVWAFAAGILCVYLYRRGRQNHVSAPDGLRMGATTGFFTFALIAVFLGAIAGIALLALPREKIHQVIMQQIDFAAARYNNDPQVREALTRLFSPEGFIISLLILFIFLVFTSGMGGALGSAIFGRKRA